MSLGRYHLLKMVGYETLYPAALRVPRVRIPPVGFHVLPGHLHRQRSDCRSHPGLFMIWMENWISSWIVAFPAVLVVAPLVRRIVHRLVVSG